MTATEMETPWPADDPHGMAATYGINARHCRSWHESGHTIVALALGQRVRFVTIGDAAHHDGNCHWEDHVIGRLAAGDAALRDACRGGGAILCGGAVATAMRRAGLGLPMRSAHERLSASDLAGYRYYAALSPESPDQLFRASTRLAADTLERHRPAFHAFVAALLERHTLGEAELRELWRQHAHEAA